MALRVRQDSKALEIKVEVVVPEFYTEGGLTEHSGQILVDRTVCYEILPPSASRQLRETTLGPFVER